MKIGRNTDVKYPSSFELPGDGEVVDLLTRVAELGLNFIDTAPAYGSSEERIGRLLPGSRDDWILSTKVGEIYADGRSRFDFSPGHVESSVHESCRRLRTDRLDMVMIHSDGVDETEEKFDPALVTLESLKHKGTIRAFGISSKTPES